ncbi:MAG TPA: class I SAM-dependent rRNA methyltransferase, partial [Steroidobacteraceae bacterium]|nr:class I SAM-dependent rRNA methyltransferase [Steroidobacteraceae bacterium]
DPAQPAASAYPVVRLKPGRDRPLLLGHPWVFSGALQEVPADLAPGEVVDLHSARGEFVARAYLNPRNSLAARVLTDDPEQAIDEAFFAARIRQAAALRASLERGDTNAYRVVHAEGDRLPGLIVDRYDRWLVAQVHTAGIERLRTPALAALGGVLAPEGILLRNDLGVRAREGLPVGGVEVVAGSVPEEAVISEGGIRYYVDLRHGQKTGFFLDQRDKRARIREHAADARTLLNLFAYSGGFALAALAGNPALRTTNVDASAAAMELARRNYALNGHDPAGHGFVTGDAVAYLKERVAEGARYDVVIADPPAYAKSQASKARALYGYDTLNTLAARVVASGGLLLTCSCTGVVDLAEFEAVVQGALLHARRHAQLIESFTVSLDHPTLLGFPEDRYLKALLLRVL